MFGFPKHVSFLLQSIYRIDNALDRFRWIDKPDLQPYYAISLMLVLIIFPRYSIDHEVQVAVSNYPTLILLCCRDLFYHRLSSYIVFFVFLVVFLVVLFVVFLVVFLVVHLVVLLVTRCWLRDFKTVLGLNFDMLLIFSLSLILFPNCFLGCSTGHEVWVARLEGGIQPLQDSTNGFC